FGWPLPDASVEPDRPAVRPERAAAEENRALAAIRQRPQRDRQMFPVDEIAAARVSPVLIAAAWLGRIELIEEVVPPLVEDRAIRIVVPERRRAEMIDRALGICLRRRHARPERLHRAL